MPLLQNHNIYIYPPHVSYAYECIQEHTATANFITYIMTWNMKDNYPTIFMNAKHSRNAMEIAQQLLVWTYRTSVSHAAVQGCANVASAFRFQRQSYMKCTFEILYIHIVVLSISTFASIAHKLQRYVILETSLVCLAF